MMTLSNKEQSADKTLMYLSYGTGPHLQDTIFSLLTAYHFLPPDTPGYRYVLYTDDPAPFAGLGLTIREFDAAEFHSWLGDTGFAHRSKIVAIQDALARYGGSVVFMDSDTYFQRSPAELFARTGPGRGIMHVLESRLGSSGEPVHERLISLVKESIFQDSNGKRVALSPASPMWNTGVIGLHAQDAVLLEDALTLCDQLWKKQPSRLMEQFALSHALGSLQLSEAMDIVFHYWPGHLRGNFRQRIAPLLAATAHEPLDSRAAECYRQRPKPSLAARLKATVKHTLAKAGVRTSGVIRSA